jgi:hypothetical protein
LSQSEHDPARNLLPATADSGVRATVEHSPSPAPSREYAGAVARYDFIESVLADPPTTQDGWMAFARAVQFIDFRPPTARQIADAQARAGELGLLS